jgi:hypothetical protein
MKNRCAAQFSKNRKPYLTLGSMGFLAYSNKSKMKLAFFCVYGLVIVGSNNFLNLEIDTFLFW